MRPNLVQVTGCRGYPGGYPRQAQPVWLCLVFVTVLSVGGCTQRPGTAARLPSVSSSPAPSIETTSPNADVSLYQSAFFQGAILRAPGVTDLGEVCSETETFADGSTSVGFCYPVDSEVYLQAVVEAPSDNALPCPGYVDRIVTLWAIPARALEDGVLRSDDFDIFAPHDNNGFIVSHGVATAAIARLSPETAAAYPAGAGFTPGVFLVSALGHPVQAQVSPDLILNARRVSEVLLSMNGDNGARSFRNLPLEPSCTEQMVLAEGIQLIEPDEPLSDLPTYDCDHPYAPARDGAYWEYDQTIYYPDHGPDQLYFRYEVLAHRVSTDLPFPGLVVWTVSGSGSSEAHETRCLEAGQYLNAHRVGWLPPDHLLVPGFTWTHDQRRINDVDWIETYTVLSVDETITTPAGSFNTIKVGWTNTYEYEPWTTAYERLWYPVSGTEWFAMGVGVVHSETSERAGVGAAMNILTLTTYSVP